MNKNVIKEINNVTKKLTLNHFANTGVTYVFGSSFDFFR